MPGRNFWGLLIGSTALLSVADTTSVRAQVSAQQATAQQRIHNFNIPAQPLAGALTAFARQSGLQLAYPASLAAGKTAPAVNGALSQEAALSALLAGSGLSYRFAGANVVAISAVEGAASTVDGDSDTVLRPIVLRANRGLGGSPDAPYETPGSVSYISAEQLDRVRPTSASDMFLTTPGVISAGSRVGASITPNIRGLQGQGRIASSIDGARQSTSSYRGYVGNREEVYVDPDMIGGIDISKGPSSGVGVGANGGSINFRTLEASDIVKQGRNYGFRVKTDIGSNTRTESEPGPPLGRDRPGFINGDAWSGSIAGAVTEENYDFIAAYSHRKAGNYFAGSHVPDGTTVASNTPAYPGEEVPNTSLDVNSYLAKGTLRFGDAHSLQLGFMRYDARYGEIDELAFATSTQRNQLPLTHTIVDTYTAKYRYNPDDNPLIDLRINGWVTDLDVSRSVNGWAPYGMLTKGGDISNTSVFDTPLGQLTWQNGFEVLNEDAEAVSFLSFGTWMSFGPIGKRTLTSGFTKASLEVTDWLTLDGGLRYDHYTSEAGDYLSIYPKTSGDRVNPNVAVTVEPLDGLQFYGLYTEGYRPPSLRESHWNYGVLLQVNPNLQPELAKNIEFGINYLKDGVITAGDKLRFKASVFNNKYEDYIIRRRPPDWDFGYRWDNIDHARYRGVELSASYDAGTFFLEGGYTYYTDIRYCETASTCTQFALGSDYGANYVPPEYSGSVTAGIRAFDQKLTLGARTHFASERSGGKIVNGGFSAPQTWPKYTVVDIFGSYDFENDMKLNFSVENVMDDYYVGALSSVGVANPGRTFRMSLTKTF
ncbi:TonB-dependent receptor domain-containing protein [Neorhizobium sp. DT-125]|uniref:TonB-dependent receptor n=1 Tax=Neorhizobium sp. DT-125 TaxID=3396163 RepID=UPI003F1B4600